MSDYGHELGFGVFATPLADRADQVVELAKIADVAGLDLVSFQDHPYQPRFLDTWTLLSHVAAETSSISLAPNVANLPLRPPAVLARSVASLDILSRGRVELGLGAGAFWDGVEAMGGPRRTPGESVDALSEAIDVIRGVWDTGRSSVRVRGEHYAVDGAKTGPAPAHDVSIWLGAYKPRMLRLTGRKADGWLPSLGYAKREELAEMNARIDDAAAAAGRDPVEIRRLLNLGSFGGGGPFPQGDPSSWPEQIAELALADGISTFILAADTAEEIARWAEIAPVVRELVAAERGRARDDERPPDSAPGSDLPVPDEPPTEEVAAALAMSSPASAPAPAFGVEPTPDDGVRLSGEAPWDEATRPAGPPRDPHRSYTPHEEATGRHLIDVHDALRAELERLRDLIEQVAAGQTDASRVRSFITRMTIRQNNWTLGTFCETYCGHVTGHHTLEDRSVFPHLRRADSMLAPVIDRLGEEHEVIADILERVDEALVSLVSSEPDGIGEVRAAVDLLTDAMNSHFAYEERELIEPLARLGFN